MLKFNFVEKGLGLVFPTHFVYNAAKRLLHMLRSIN